MSSARFLQPDFFSPMSSARFLQPNVFSPISSAWDFHPPHPQPMTAREFTEPLHSHANLIEVLRWRAEHQPDRTAYVFLPTGETEEVPMTYFELDRQARAIGAYLQSLAPRGSRVMLLFQPGLDYTAAFMACLYAGMIAVPAYPPRPNRGFSRIQAISADAQANIALTTTSIFEKIQRTLTETPDLQQLAWVETDTLDAGWEQNWVHPAPSDRELAFLQYTSGSTGTPRGVMVSHGNISANLEAMRRQLECHADRPGALWLPPYHDMGLLAMLQALYTGFPCVLMPPTAFLQKPVRWLNAISKYRVYVSGGPNFGFDLCTRKVTEA
ncbi:MAG TPA: AMP-binding protein, partial [Acidobacteriota bacterium]|nr:AMP-binding protein [Acidobacteriota bacterium]